MSVAVPYLVVFVMPTQRFFVDEAGDGVLFGPQGRSHLNDPDAMRFFMLGKVSIVNEAFVPTTAVTPIMIVASTSGRLIHGPTLACK